MPTAAEPDTLRPELPPEKQDSRRMREMFSTISPRYDFITRVFSYGMDRRWKRDGVKRARLRRGALVLDLAAGTGDFTKIVEREISGARSVAVDLTFPMLRLARQDGVARAVCGDAMRLPFPDAVFDAVFVGYGLRNFPHLADALAEILRVLKPGGCLVSLDFFLPANSIFRRLYLGYLYVNGFFWGLLLHGRPRIYTYIPDSLSSFVTIDEHCTALTRCGYRDATARRFILGGIGLHWAVRG
jgi:demethylmenaquinone methyltransferase/2-methoxy-6-polyprenyl-1,4-benzoquinol methylase